MVGITLSPEQIRSAPPEVRHWLENEIARSLGLHPVADTMAHDAPRLAACSPEEAMAVYASIRGMLPVVNIFFELGREGVRTTEADILAFRLADMLRHTHLPDVERLAACLQVIDEAFQQVRNEEGAPLFILDPRGYCVVSATTRQSILAVWKQELSTQALAGDGSFDRGGAVPPRPFATSGIVPARSISLGMPFAAPAGPAQTAGAESGSL
jgi:hypothetical protein